MTVRYHKRNWDVVITYLKAHPEGVTGAQLLEAFHVWQIQTNATLKSRLRALGYELVGEQLPGNRAGRPKCYKLKAL